jgi:predicted nucleotidyltransferase
MTSTSERRLVFLDANVLAAPTTRSLILRATEHRATRFAVCWTLRAESEADQALDRRARERGERLGRTVPHPATGELRV